MHCKFSEGRTGDREKVSLDGMVLPQSNHFKYLGSILQVDEECEEDVSHRIKARWLKWRRATGVLCNRKIPNKLKKKFYHTTIRPAMLYCSECWPLKESYVSEIKVAEMRILRWMSGHTKLDEVHNKSIREKIGVVLIEDKLREERLR